MPWVVVCFLLAAIPLDRIRLTHQTVLLYRHLYTKGLCCVAFIRTNIYIFTSTGTRVGTLHVGSWTTSLIQVECIHVASTNIELKGSRWARVYDQQSNFHSVRTSQQVHVVVDRESSATDAAVIEVVENLFANKNENMVNLVPDYSGAYGFLARNMRKLKEISRLHRT